MHKETIEFMLSKYKILTKLNEENKKTEIFLVQDSETKKIFIKKILTKYDIEVFKILKEVNSINIPRIFECYELDGKLIVIEEFINGQTLEEIRVNNGNKLKEETVLKYMISLCDALELLHSLNPMIVHRDIKPANVIISNDDVVKLIDYDVSRRYKFDVSGDTYFLGTAGYAAPEQHGYEQSDCRSDIFSLGVMMNVLTMGKDPREEKNNGYLKEIIKKCIRISPDNRFQSVLALKKELEEKMKEIEVVNLLHKDTTVLENKFKNIELVKTLDNKERDNEYYEKIRIKNNGYKNKEDYSTDKKEYLVKQNITFKNIYKIIPGFRTCKVWKTILATVWYLFLALLFFIDVKNTSKFQQAYMVVILLLFTTLYTNFLNIKDKLPFIKNKQLNIKVFGYIFYTIVLFVIFGVLIEQL